MRAINEGRGCLRVMDAMDERCARLRAVVPQNECSGSFKNGGRSRLLEDSKGNKRVFKLVERWRA